MALNLSTLTNASTSGDVLAEALTTADFLENVPVLRNLARGSQKGGDAKQDVALNQPKALPLIKNPAGDLGGYLYIPDVAGNSAEGPSVTIGANQTWEAEVDMVITQYGNYIKPLGGGAWTSGFSLLIYSDGRARVFSKSDVSNLSAVESIPLNTPFNVKYGFNGSAIYIELNDQSLITTSTGSNQASVLTEDLKLQAQPSSLGSQGNYAIQKAKLTVNSAVVFDCDFNGSTSIRHGDTKFNCVGGPVVLNQSGNDPATVIKKSVLRFDGVNDGLNGLFNQTVTGGYMFAAFSVLGDGGENFGRIFSVNSTGAADHNTSGAIFALRNAGTTTLDTYFQSNYRLPHVGLLDDENGDILHEAKIINGSQSSLVNNADLKSTALSTFISSEEFNVCVGSASNPNNTAIDLEFLALFPATITDDQVADVVKYINNRNNVFSLIDSQGYYFFDPQIFPIVDPAAFVSYWNGNIVGSDFTLNASVSQSVVNDRPTRDGYKITFNDNADRLVVASPLSGGQAGWQVVGTSLGTFAYRVNANAVTELNLLGNAGGVRSIGDLYGIILLPASATGKDIEDARKLLIDRGASDEVSVTSLTGSWLTRSDIVEFKYVNTSSVTSLNSSWYNATRLETFPLIDTTSVTEMQYAWENTDVRSFPAIQAPLCSNFTASWKSTDSLTSFPAGAKLGTSASNVNFTSAWQSSGLTSFPALDLSKGNSFHNAWNGCTALTSFPSGAKLGTSASNVNFTNAWRASGLTSFPALDLSKGSGFHAAWYDSSITQFASGLDLSNATDVSYAWGFTPLTSFPLVQVGNVPYFLSSWQNCTSLLDFPANFFDAWSPTGISNGVFNNTWKNCTALTAQSVENILTSINASGKYATSTGASGGSALGDAGIDIDYNTATGSLSAATNTAVTSLKAKGWSIIVNNVTL